MILVTIRIDVTSKAIIDRLSRAIEAPLVCVVGWCVETVTVMVPADVDVGDVPAVVDGEVGAAVLVLLVGTVAVVFPAVVGEVGVVITVVVFPGAIVVDEEVGAVTVEFSVVGVVAVVIVTVVFP